MKNHGASTTLFNRVLTVPQAAAEFQVSERTIYEWLRDGKLPGRKIGRVWRMSASALEDFLRGAAVVTGPGAAMNHEYVGEGEEAQEV